MDGSRQLEQHRLIRSSEQVVFPMIGDGVSPTRRGSTDGQLSYQPCLKK